LASKLKAGFEDALAELKRRGLMLVHDKTFPSLTLLCIGEPIRGSWWAHPLSNGVYVISQRLQQSGEVMLIKLVSGKETYVHRRLWPQAVAIGMSRDNWQLDSLPGSALELLDDLDRAGSVRIDQIRTARPRKDLSADARSLANRMLLFADDVHTESGAHVRRLETWQSWAVRHNLTLETLPPASAAREELDRIVAEANIECSAGASLPWHTRSRR
jgi:hypothetical protein